MEPRRTHFSQLEDPGSRATVARAGAVAEELLGNSAIHGCGGDQAAFDAAMREIREEEGVAAATQAELECESKAKEIVSGQIDATRALAEPVGRLINKPKFAGNAELDQAACEAIGRSNWQGVFPPDQALEH